MIKFRSMHKEKEDIIQATSHNDPRITRFGKLMRRSHIDEFPQFINVLLGQMSLVGPRAERAELVAALQEVVPFYRARFLVKPGLTGWAQINFGYASSIEDTATKLEYDLYYIKHRSLMMDLITILRTASSVICYKGLENMSFILNIRNRYVLIGDLLLLVIAVLGGYVLRLELGAAFIFYFPSAMWMMGTALVIKPMVYYLFGLYRRIWIYASIQEMKIIALAVTTASIVVSLTMVAMFIQGFFVGFPRSVLIIDWLIVPCICGRLTFFIAVDS